MASDKPTVNDSVDYEFNDSLRSSIQDDKFPGVDCNDPICDLTTRLLEEIGEDVTREGLIKTPQRVAGAWRYITNGYSVELDEIINNAIFHESAIDEMVIVRDIEFYSLCEHHMLPFYGIAHVAYIPKGKVIGLSKIPRIVDVYARRLQLQERMTMQIAQTLMKTLNPLGAAVVTEAHHLCMMMRGVQKQNSSAMSSAMLGAFRTSARTRNEFLMNLAKK